MYLFYRLFRPLFLYTEDDLAKVFTALNRVVFVFHNHPVDVGNALK
ncbi:hypothetical protein SARI_04360 [Salmonella enterica subsp. arizonae serovar 62:z4,z23:-]|uniref:Uncharacterized protein n=1 Tax=Salmonella arizonae (strain ATCC BAA-731 / CDC346-86 / RSK2980) TaxID=41514 RepID=A9MPP6_SALAR|nr:hypothetical protein SARI_04360 [Salmonella enterica subsp. arizonae serovar 62:z4,z23:-]